MRLLPAKSDASPGRFRLVRPFGDRTPPAPTRARQIGPSDAAGTCQADACGGATCLHRTARPKRNADQTPPVAALPGGNRYRPFARENLCRDPPRSDRPPRWPGCPLRKFLARRYGARAPKLTAFRRPKLRQPRPSAWNGRSGQYRIRAKSGENLGGGGVGRIFPGASICMSGREIVRPGGVVFRQLCLFQFAQSCASVS